MNNGASFRNRYRFTFQAIAFAMISLPAIGLYQSASNGNAVLTALLMGVVAAGMVLAIWVN
ncbi:MAG: hypothetical protein KAR65_11485 [Anaerolineales bacterium]|nr:hypothetical protein [Anaerolineales bacterium]MCK5635291.1 hypothetical protein [Anaerolineales bacterium]